MDTDDLMVIRQQEQEKGGAIFFFGFWKTVVKIQKA
jgi:hypothetical protein